MLVVTGAGGSRAGTRGATAHAAGFAAEADGEGGAGGASGAVRSGGPLAALDIGNGGGGAGAGDTADQPGRPETKPVANPAVATSGARQTSSTIGVTQRRSR